MVFRERRRFILGKVIGPILNVGTIKPSEYIINCDILIEYCAPRDVRGEMRVKRNNEESVCFNIDATDISPNKSQSLVIIITGKSFSCNRFRIHMRSISK
jgi:hypothetical protein